MTEDTVKIEELKANLLSFLANFKSKASFAHTILNKLAAQAKGHTRQSGEIAWYDEYFNKGSSNPYGNNLPMYLVNKLAEVRENALQNNLPDQLSQTRQDITDVFFILSHLYAISKATANQQLGINTKQALQSLLIKYPLNIINILHFSDKKQKAELNDLIGSSRQITSLLGISLSPEAIYDPENKDNFIDNFYLDFNQQIEAFKKQEKGQLSQEHIARLTMQVNYLIQINNSLPDTTTYTHAKNRLNALINSCCKAVPEIGKQLAITIPSISTIGFSHEWENIAGSARKYAQIDVIKHYDSEINQLHGDYVTLINHVITSLVKPNTNYHQSIQDINKEVNQYRLALQNIEKSPTWAQAYEEKFKQFEHMRSKLKLIKETCQEEYNNLIDRQQLLKQHYNAELNKINNYQHQFIELHPEEENELENKRKELTNIYLLHQNKIEVRKQELQSVIAEVQKSINSLPDIDAFQKDVVKKIEATMVSLAGQGGEKDQIFEKIGGDIFDSKSNLLEKLGTLSEQAVPETPLHVGAIVLEHQVNNIDNNLSRLQGTGFDEKLRAQYQALRKAIADNNTELAKHIDKMNVIVTKIQNAKQDPIPSDSILENKNEIPLNTLKNNARPKSPDRHSVESNHNLEQLDEHPVFYERAGKLIDARNEAIAQLQSEYDSLKQKNVALEDDNVRLFGELKDVESDVQDKASSIKALDNRAAELLANAIAERESIRSQELNQLNSSENDSKQGLIDLANSKNKFVASVKKDRSLIIDANGKSVSDLPASLEKDAIKSFDYLESHAEKLVESKIKMAEVCVNRTRQLQNGMKQKQKERDARLSKVPANFKQYCSENQNQTFDQCVVNYGAQLDEIEKEFNQSKTKQRKENREKAITQLKNDFSTITTESKNDIDDINRLDDGRKHVMSELREKSRALDKSTKRTFASFLGGLGGAITGAIVGLIAGPIGVIVGGIIGAGIGSGAGYAASGIIPTNPPQDSFANTPESSSFSANSTESEDNSAEFEINDLFSGNKVAIVNTENAIMADIPTNKNEKDFGKNTSSSNSNNKEDKDELSEIKTDEDFNNYIFGENGYKNGKTIEPLNVSKIPGTSFHRAAKPENVTKLDVSPTISNSRKNTPNT